MIDKSKSYGEVHGNPTHPYKFEQGNKFFNIHGYECTYQGKQIEFPADEPEPEPPPKTVMRMPAGMPTAKPVQNDSEAGMAVDLPPVVTPKKRGRPRKS